MQIWDNDFSREKIINQSCLLYNGLIMESFRRHFQSGRGEGRGSINFSTVDNVSYKIQWLFFYKYTLCSVKCNFCLKQGWNPTDYPMHFRMRFNYFLCTLLLVVSMDLPFIWLWCLFVALLNFFSFVFTNV